MDTYSFNNFKENREDMVAQLGEIIPSMSSILVSSKGTFNEIYDGLTQDIPKLYGKEQLEGTIKLINDVCNAASRDFLYLIGKIVSDSSEEVKVSKSLSLTELENKFHIRIPSDTSTENIRTQNLLIETPEHKRESRQLLIVQNTHEQIINEILRITRDSTELFALILTFTSILPEEVTDHPENQMTSNIERTSKNVKEDTSNAEVRVDRVRWMEIPAVNTMGDVVENVIAWVKATEEIPDKEINDYIHDGNNLFDENRLEDALVMYEKALVLEPNAAEPWYRKGLVYSKLEQPVKALECFDVALTRMPDYYEALIETSILLSRVLRFDDALGMINRAIVLKENDSDNWIIKGIVLFELKRYDSALEAFDKASDLKPDAAEPWYRKGLVYFELQRYENALESFDKSLKIESNNADTLYMKGKTLNKLERYDEAVEYFGAAIKNSPRYSEAYYGRAISHAKIKNHRNAISDLKKSIDFAQRDKKDSIKKEAKQDENFENIRQDERFQHILDIKKVPAKSKTVTPSPVELSKPPTREAPVEASFTVASEPIYPSSEFPRSDLEDRISKLNDLYQRFIATGEITVYEMWTSPGDMATILLDQNEHPQTDNDRQMAQNFLAEIPMLLSELRHNQNSGNQTESKNVELRIRQKYSEAMQFINRFAKYSGAPLRKLK